MDDKFAVSASTWPAQPTSVDAAHPEILPASACTMSVTAGCSAANISRDEMRGSNFSKGDADLPAGDLRVDLDHAFKRQPFPVVAEPRRDVHAKRQDCVRLQPKIKNLYACRVGGFRNEPLNHSLVLASRLDDHFALLRPERSQLRVANESLLGML